MIEIQVEDPAWHRALPDVETIVARAAAAVPGADRRPDGEPFATVLLADDDAVQALNARFRGRDAPTNVLSFPASSVPGLPEAAYLGDIILAFEVCRGEAEAQGKPLAHHLSHLVIHGLLHLQGHDHQSDEEAEVMEARERTLLAGLGIDDPYRAILDREP